MAINVNSLMCHQKQQNGTKINKKPTKIAPKSTNSHQTATKNHHKKPPKSTGRDKFGAEYIQRVIQRHPHISPPDLLRTFIAFTAKSIVENMTRLRNFTPDNSRLIISGGGVHHPLIMQDLSQFTGHGKIFDSNKVGINPDMKESLLMAILGVACVKGIPANMPSVTGADTYAVLGEIR